MKNPFAKWKQQYGSTKEDSFISKQKKTILPSKTSSFSSVKNQDEKERNETTSEEYIVTVPYKASRYPKNNNNESFEIDIEREEFKNKKRKNREKLLHKFELQ